MFRNYDICRDQGQLVQVDLTQLGSEGFLKPCEGSCRDVDGRVPCLSRRLLGSNGGGLWIWHLFLFFSQAAQLLSSMYHAYLRVVVVDAQKK